MTSTRRSPRPRGGPENPAHWEDISTLRGRHSYSCPLSGNTYWDLVGPAAEAWRLLGPRACARVQVLAKAETIFSIHMAVVGKSEQTATPRIVFCVQDGALREAIQNDGALHDIIRDYPSIEMDFSTHLPQLLAGEESPSGASAPSAPYSVWATEASPRIGTQFYVQCRIDGRWRKSTAGPVFYHEGRNYQTTVRHVFFRPECAATAPVQPAFQLDLDLDLDLDDSDVAPSGNTPHRDDDNYSHDDLRVRTSQEVGGAQEASASPDADEQSQAADVQHHPPGSGVSFSTHDGPPALMEEVTGDDDAPGPSKVYVGNAVSETVEGMQRAVDYALVEIPFRNNIDPNIISYDRSDPTKRVRVTRPAEMDRIMSGAPVVVVTSSGPVRGKLFKTPAYIKPRSQRETLEVYPLMLDDGMALEPGDCGSLAVELREGDVPMLGHVVFGHPGTSVAYILPMEVIVQDMAQVLRLGLHQRTIRLQRGPGPWRDRFQQGGGLRTAFASPKFYAEMDEELMPATHTVRGLLAGLGNKVSRSTRALVIRKPRPKAVKATRHSFGGFFFRMPQELQDQVVSYLNFRDAMSLRHVSQGFRAAVTVNGSAISRLFLVSNPLPPLALRLYPSDAPDLAHIHSVGHRHAVVWRLADHMAQWLRGDIFLYGSRFQKEAFQPRKVRIKQRLLPSLFLLGHFFETSRAVLEEQAQEISWEDGSGPVPIVFPFEREMVESSNQLIFQTLDVMLLLVTFLRRTMRAPSKYSPLERTARLGLARPPSDRQIAAVLCHGGLEAVTDILDLGTLDKKTAAVRAYSASPPPPPGKAVGSGDSDDGAEEPPLDLGPLLPRLPDLDQIWRPSAEALLRERMVIRGRRDLNTYAAALRALIHGAETPADELYREGHDLWHALSDNEKPRERKIVLNVSLAGGRGV